jgi:hypothetical protein
MTNIRVAPFAPLLILLLALAGCLNTEGQQFEWKTGFFGFFDNREYFSDSTIPQTMGGENLSAEAGFAGPGSAIRMKMAAREITCCLM